MGQKNFIVLCDDISTAGAQRSAVNLARALTDSGHNVVFIALEKTVEPAFETPFPVVYLSDQKIKPNIGRVKRLANRLTEWVAAQSLTFDLVISNNYICNLVLKKTKIKSRVFVVHNPPRVELKIKREKGLLKYLRWYYAKFLSFSNEHLIAVSEDIAESLRRDKSLKPKSVHSIHNIMYCSEMIARSGETAELPVGEYLIHVGRFAEQKNHHYLFDAIANTKTSMPLVVLCDQGDKAKELAEQKGIKDRLIVPGLKKNPFPWIKNAKALLLCSRYEGFPFVVSEALMLGVPVIALNIATGPREQLEGSVCEPYLLDKSTPPEGFAKAIDQLVGSDIAIDPGKIEFLKHLSPECIVSKIEACADFINRPSHS